MRRRIAASAAVIALAAFGVVGSTAMAGAAVYSTGSTTGTFPVSAQITPSASVSANPLTFFTFGNLQTSVTSNAIISVTASNTTPYNVGINAGTGAGSTTDNRYMAGTGANTATLAYKLRRSVGGPNWGNTQGTDTLSGTGTGSAQPITVYGEIPAQPTPQPDSYSSLLTVTVYF